MEVHLCCSKQRLNLQCICLLFSTRKAKSAHTWGQVVGSERTGLFMCMRRTHFAGTMGKLVHTKLSVHFNVVEENVCKRSAQYVTLKIEVIFFHCFMTNDVKPAELLTKCCGNNNLVSARDFYFTKKGQVARGKLSLIHVPPSCPHNMLPSVGRAKCWQGTCGSLI